MRALEEFKNIADLPYNEDIEINPYSLQLTSIDLDQLLIELNLRVNKFGGSAFSYQRAAIMGHILRINVPEENIPKPEPEPQPGVSFSHALDALKAGKKVKRQDSTYDYLKINASGNLFVIKVGARHYCYSLDPEDVAASDWIIINE